MAERFLPALRAAFAELNGTLGEVPGASVEDNVFSVTVHFRKVRSRGPRFIAPRDMSDLRAWRRSP